MSCGRPATVLDHVRTGDSWPNVYICKTCFAREYPDLQPIPFDQTDMFTVLDDILVPDMGKKEKKRVGIS